MTTINQTETKEERSRRIRLEANKRYYEKNRQMIIDKVKQNYNKKLAEDEEATKKRTRELYKKRYDESEKLKEYKKKYYEQLKAEYEDNKQFYQFLKNESSIKSIIV